MTAVSLDPAARAVDAAQRRPLERLLVWLLSPTMIVVWIALAASAVGIANWFTYDDRYIVELNTAVHTLHHWWRLFAQSYWPSSWGSDGYRPITMLAYAVEWWAGRGTAVMFHLTNIVLYCAVSASVFSLGRRTMSIRAAWLAAAFFAANPVHVEAVANIVGQSELSVALTTIWAVVLYVDARQAGSLPLRTALAIGALYAVGCFAKEHGIMMPGLLIAAEVLLITDARPWRERILALRPFFLALLGVAVGYFGIHTLVLSDKAIGGFQPFVPFQALKLSNTDRILTMFGVVPQWLRLFYWPERLSSEYGPPDIQIAQGPSVSQIPGLFLLIGILGLAIALRRRRPMISFGVAWICITLLPSSNFIVPAGILLAERTLLLPSVGAMFIAGDVVDQALARFPALWRNLSFAAVAAVLLAGVVRSARRTTVWHDNDRLFNQAVIDAPLAYRAHYMLGAWDFENHRKSAGEREYRRALNLFPYDPFLAYNMASQYRQNAMCGPALAMYEWAFSINTYFTIGKGEYAFCLLDQGHFADARAEALEAMRYAGQGPLKQLRFILQTADSALANGSRKGPIRASLGGGKVPEPVQKTANPSGSGVIHKL